MNKEDEFWFFVMKAITAATTNNNFYFYDNIEDMLFALKKEKKEFFPIYRNTARQSTIQNVETISRAIQKVKRLDNQIIQLPKLSLEEKKDFFIGFLSTIKDTLLKSKLQSSIITFSENDDFLFTKKISSDLDFRYDMGKGKFITDKIKEIYYPLGISEKSKVIW